MNYKLKLKEHYRLHDLVCGKFNSKYVASYILSKWQVVVKMKILRIMTFKHLKIKTEIKRNNETKNETKFFKN